MTHIYRYEPKADIAKCPGNACPEREICLRYLRPAAECQVYCDFTLHQHINRPCEHRIAALPEHFYAIG